MARLIYTAITSLDGYVNDVDGNFDWAAPDHEVHSFVNDLERPIGTYLYGRRLYETMRFWETVPTGPDEPSEMNDYAALWRAADKIVYSRTLSTPSTERTKIERDFDADQVRALVDHADSDVSIGGPGLASTALRAGVIDEIRLFIGPVVVGGGTAALPAALFQRLRLQEARRFEVGVVYVRYDVDRS